MELFDRSYAVEGKIVRQFLTELRKSYLIQIKGGSGSR